MYEMLVGYPPFYSKEPMSTCRKVKYKFTLIFFSIKLDISLAVFYIFIMQIVNWKTYLKFPEEAKLSFDAKDLVSRLLCNVDQRLGTRGAHEITVRILEITI